MKYFAIMKHFELSNDLYSKNIPEEIFDLLIPVVSFGKSFEANFEESFEKPNKRGCTILDIQIRRFRENPSELAENLFVFFKDQPYGIMATAFLIGGAGAHETAALDLVKWLDEYHQREQPKTRSERTFHD